MDTGAPDVDALVAELRARVEERRSQGAYPPGLEHGLSEQARLSLTRRVHSRRAVDLGGLLARVGETLPLSSERIAPVPSRGVGSAVNRMVAKAMQQPIDGVVTQIQAFAAPVSEALGALAAAVEELQAEVEILRPPLRAVIERQAVEERVTTQAAARAPAE